MKTFLDQDGGITHHSPPLSPPDFLLERFSPEVHFIPLTLFLKNLKWLYREISDTDLCLPPPRYSGVENVLTGRKVRGNMHISIKIKLLFLD